MSQRRYGPVEGAGVVVIEKDAEKQISKGTLGVTTYVGILERGPVGKLIRVGTKTDYLRKCGSYIDESLLPDNAFDFYKTSRGAGELYAVRITDGSEVQSKLNIKARVPSAVIKNCVADCAGDKAYISNGDYLAMGSPKVNSRIAVANDEKGTVFYRVSAVLMDTPSAGIVELALTGAVLTDYTVASGARILLFNTAINPEVMEIKAHNGGRWAGKKQVHTGVDFGLGGLTAITFDTGLTLLKDQLKGGLLNFDAIPGKSYTVLSNTIAGIVTVASDSDMASDYIATGSSSENWKVQLFNDGKELSVVFKDGIIDPIALFGMEIYVDGALVLDYTDLSMDPNSKYYFESYINDDDNNEFIVVDNLWTGSILSSVRPANIFGQSVAISNTEVTLEIVKTLADGANTGDGYVDAYTYGGDLQDDVITLECLSLTPATFNYTSQKLGVLAVNVIAGTPFVAPNDFGLGFTVVEGVTGFAVGDKISLYVSPMVPDSLVGGYVYPNVDSERRFKAKIISNTYDKIVVKASAVMKDYAVVGNSVRVEFDSDLGGGYDGVSDITDIDYLKALDPSDSVINNFVGMGKGLVKIAVPGITSSAVQKAGAEYAEARNYQFRYEIPSNIVNEESAEAYINETIGRNDFAVVEFPSYIYVTHPTKAGLKLIPATGAIHGNEALFAKNYLGYHKAAAGVDAKIAHCIKLPTGDRTVDEEILNKHGIGILKFKNGNCIIWGDRTVSIDPAWKWKHQREMMSYYENDMREKFDWIVFAINDEEEEKIAKSALTSYFKPEWKKRALRGEEFSDACEIKLDAEINTNSTRANGDMFSEVSLQLADTVERFVITMSKMGIFEAVS